MKELQLKYECNPNQKPSCIYMKALTTFICILFPFITWGQTTKFSYDELKEGFITQYIKKESTKTLDSLDILYWSTKDSSRKDWKEPKFYLLGNSSLHKADDISLPVSTFAYLNETDNKTGHDVHTLYWIEPRLPHFREYEQLKRKLRKKYGYITLRDSTILIPAKWFSGEIKFMESPFLYGNQFISKRLCLATLINGQYCPADEETPAFSSRWKDGGELEFTIYHLESMMGNGQYQSNNISPLLKREKALFLFSKNVSQHLDLSFLPDDYRSKEFTVMLRLDETLKAHLNVLKMDELTIEDRLVLTALSMAIEQQPAAQFSGFWCERGLYPAIFLTVNLSKRSGCNFKYYDDKNM